MENIKFKTNYEKNFFSKNKKNNIKKKNIE
jgi:hypothetical protein